MSKERELLARVVRADIADYIDIIKEAEQLLAQPEQEPSSDDFMYNKLKESYDELVESSFKDFQKGFARALELSVKVDVPSREPLNVEAIYDQAIWSSNTKQTFKEIFEEGVRWAERQHGIGESE
jgi:hypothetical protein